MILEVLLFFGIIFVFYKIYLVLGHYNISPILRSTFSFSFTKDSLFSIDTPLVLNPDIGSLNNFDQLHFLQGALKAYQLFVASLFNHNILECRPFLNNLIYEHIKSRLHEKKRLVHHNILFFSLISAQQDSHGIQTIVKTKSTLVIHDLKTQYIEKKLLSHELSFFRLSKAPLQEWKLIALELEEG